MNQSEETTKMGQRGAVVIPAGMRKRFSLDTGSLLIAVATSEGILLKPAKAVPLLTDIASRKDVKGNP